jgi:hypothetical protein
VHTIADIHDPGDDLAADPKSEIGFVAGAHDADELARRGIGLELDALHLHRPFGLGRRRGFRLAARKQERTRERGQ